VVRLVFARPARRLGGAVVVPQTAGRKSTLMAAMDRRAAARANQRAAAFIRFQMLGDHEAMHYVLTDAADTPDNQLGFTTALASIAGSVATLAMGREQALAYLQSVAENSAMLSGAIDIDSFFDD
jgi:hypothetical protein